MSTVATLRAVAANLGLPIITADQRLAERRGIKGVLAGKSGLGKTASCGHWMPAPGAWNSGLRPMRPPVST